MNRSVLSDEEIRSYRENGYLVPGFALSGDQVMGMRRLADELIGNHPELGDTPMVCPHIPGGGVQGLRGNRDWLDYSKDEQVLDMVEQLIGPDIILWGTNLFHKPAAQGRRIPFHRDGRYWPIEPLATLTVWVAIEDSSRDNGCLRIVPASHLPGTVGEHFTSDDPADAIPETLRSEEFDESQAVDVELRAGQVVLFDVFTIHGSHANRGGRRRLGYAMRYMPSTSWFHHDAAERAELVSNAHNTRPLLLLRGTDRCGKNDFERGHPEPAAGVDECRAR